MKNEVLLINHHISPLDPYSPSFYGPIKRKVCNGESERSYYIYIPEKVRSSTAAIFVLAESGVSAKQWLLNSNWSDLAETDEHKEKFIVFFLEAGNNGWNLKDPEDDLEYISKVYNDSRKRDEYCVHESKYYLVGYKDGGTMAQMAAMNDPAAYAGVVSIDSPDVCEDYVSRISGLFCDNLDGYVDTDKKYKIMKKNLTVPAWIISSDSIDDTSNSNTADYWRTCSETEKETRQINDSTVEFYRKKDAPWGCNQDKEAFRVWVSQVTDASNEYGKYVNSLVWTTFLCKVRRWMAEPGGDLRINMDPVSELGMEYHYEIIDGWKHEWYLYVPHSLKNGSTKKVPLVIALHGYTCSGEIYIGNSEWYKVAEKNEFIVAFPSAVHGIVRNLIDPDNPAVGDHDAELPVWNVLHQCRTAPDELKFFDEMIQKICDSHNIDKERIFATGHSLGSLMTQLLGMARPELFAAIAPCSGVLFAESRDLFVKEKAVIERKAYQLPVWMFGGENEKWLFDALPSEGNIVDTTIKIWQNFNHMKSNNPIDYSGMKKKTGRWNDYTFFENNKPMIKYTWVDAMPHATMTEMSYRIWDEFFSKIRRKSNGEIEFDGF